MTRTERLLRLAKLRGDRAAVAILEGHERAIIARIRDRIAAESIDKAFHAAWTESELRAMWGDR